MKLQNFGQTFRTGDFLSALVKLPLKESTDKGLKFLVPIFYERCHPCISSLVYKVVVIIYMYGGCGNAKIAHTQISPPHKLCTKIPPS